MERIVVSGLIFYCIISFCSGRAAVLATDFLFYIPHQSDLIMPAQTDSGMQCLLLIAKLHHLEADENRLWHEYNPSGGKMDWTSLARAAKDIGFKVKIGSINWERIEYVPFPFIGQITSGGDGSFAIVVGARRNEEGQTEVLVHAAHETRPAKMLLAEAERVIGKQCLFLASRASLLRELGNFDFTWFIPAIIKYRKPLGEVLLMSFFLQLFALLTPIFFQVVMDKVLVHRGLTTLDVIVFAMVVVIFFEVLMGGIRTYLFTHATNRIDSELGARLFKHLLSLPQSYFEARRVGDSVARVRELENIRNFLTSSVVTVLLDFLFIFVFIIAMFIYSQTLTYIVLASLPCYIILSLIISPILRERLKEKFVRGAENQAFLVESVNGIATIKAHAVEPQMTNRWNNQLAGYINAAFKATQIGNVGSQVVQLISKLTTAAILWFGAKLVIEGELTVGQLIAFNMLAGRVSQPVIRLAQLWQDFQQVGVSMKRLGDILNAPSEHRNARQTTLPQLSGAIEFSGVNFSYPNTEKRALRQIHLSIAAGQSVGIVGRSGSGKSTLTKLAQRLYLPEAGRITIDGIDLSLADPAWLRRQIGVVLQENLLFNSSVHKNIALANPSMHMEDIIRVAQLAGAHDFIMELGEGYETIIAEHGATLSGGQRQRISIARALATDPKILIFDEATSALDYESEKLIQDNMREISKGRTLLIISHRLSAVRDCSFIIVMEQGEIVEQGTHETLLAIANGRYANLHRLQNS